MGVEGGIGELGSGVGKCNARLEKLGGDTRRLNVGIGMLIEGLNFLLNVVP